jgi:hypothetical protein
MLLLEDLIYRDIFHHMADAYTVVNVKKAWHWHSDSTITLSLTNGICVRLFSLFFTTPVDIEPCSSAL